MPTPKDDDKNTKTGADMMQRAEEYVKNPEDMAKFSKERETREKEAKEKQEADRKAAADKKKEEAK